jgi:carboxyl-terminal processing protease
MQMRKSELVLWVSIVLAVTATSVSLFYTTRGQTAVSGGNSEIYRQLDLFGEVLERVRHDYVEKPDDTKLIENAVNGMLTGLDPHSNYMNAKSYHDMQSRVQGEFGGLGMEVTMEEGIVKVVSPIENTPAEKAGLMSGDYITNLDGESVQGLTLEEAVDKMRGKPDTSIVLTIARKGKSEPFDVTLARAIIKVNPVRSEVEDDVAYIRIKQFSEQTHEELKKAIEDLKTKIGPKLKGYVLDLRNNPGGLLEQAVAVSGDFLNGGVVVTTRGRNSNETQRLEAKPHGDLTGGKDVVVLINGGSASASEIVAGALQDHKRAVIAGTRSFGKGSVQTIIPLGSRGAIRLTTARYFTPSGRTIQAKGIEPGHVVEVELPEDMKPKTVAAKGEAALPRHLKNADKNKSKDESKEQSGSSAYVPKDKTKDTQLQFALDYLRGLKPELKKADAVAAGQPRGN